MDTSIELPLIYKTEYVILGGGISELKEALQWSEKGKQVLLLVRESYLAYEICSTCRYTFSYAKEKRNKYFEMFFPDKVQRKENAKEEMVILYPDLFKIHLEDICRENNITLLYNASPIEISDTEEGKLLKIAGKFGINAILCKQCVYFLKPYNKKSANLYSVHILGVPKGISVSIEKVKIDKEEFFVTLRQGAYSENHALLEIPVNPNKRRDKFICKAKERVLKVTAFLKTIDKYSKIELGRFALDSYMGEIEELIEETTNPLPYISPEKKEEFPMMSYNRMVSFRNYPVVANTTTAKDAKEYDLVVAGGGTAGVMAAIYGARLGCKVALLEMNQDLGGTGTVGGVSTYWFGKRFLDVLEIDKKIQNIYATYQLPRKEGIWSEYDDFHPDIRSLVLTKMCMEAGVTIVYGALSYGVVTKKDGRKVNGVAIVKDGITSTYFGTYLADATGDGDIASFAKAKECYGSEKDCITYWASLAQYNSPKEYKNNFSSMLIVSDVWDYTRFILLGRKRGENTFDHGSYVSPRESRHIKGLYEVNLKDIMSMRTYEDGIYTCFSNYDPKGKLSADIIYAGLLPPQVSIQIPLRALLPVTTKDVPMEGIVVLGKAISCTHNAFPSIRMQPDLIHQGTVMGILMATAIKNKISLTDIKKEQRDYLIEYYTGDKICLENKTCAHFIDKLSVKSPSHWVDMNFRDEVKQLPETIATMTGDSNEIIPLLNKKYEKVCSKEEKIMLACYLLWYGEDSKCELVIENILGVLKDCIGLPKRNGSTMCVQLLPDHGVMPELVYQLNLLAYSKNKKIIQPFQIVLERLKKGKRDYLDNKKGIYHYIESFAYVAERTGREEFISMLLEIEKFEEFKQAFDSKNNTKLLTERHFILLLSIYKALARCGEICGYYGLIHLMSVDSLPIVASAKMELDSLLKTNHFRQPSEIKKYLESGQFIIEKQITVKKLW